MTDDVEPTGPGPQGLLPEYLYRRALGLGREAAGRSGPNPPVGCVIVRDGLIVGEGSTMQVGGDHAEVVAIRSAGESAVGAIAVVTLEPCAHHGRTPPCTEALIRAGVSAVHILQRDPDPVASGGMERLAESGIDVFDVNSLLPAIGVEAAHDLRGFVTRVKYGRPHVLLKLAQDVDGRTESASARYLTGSEARVQVHRLRADVDAVLVGGETVRKDDPRLDVRHVQTESQPRPVLLSSRGDRLLGAKALRPGSIVVTGPSVKASDLRSFEMAGATVGVVPLGADGELDLAAVMRVLLEERILTVLAEPGPRLAGALVRAGLVDSIEVHVARGATGSSDPSTNVRRVAIPELSELLLGRTPSVRRTTTDGDLIVRSVVGHDPRTGQSSEVA